MIKIPTFESFEYEHVSYSELEQEIFALADIGWEIHDLGYCSDEINKMYGVSLGDIDNKPVLYFQTHIHGGHEWHTAHWGLEFCRQIVNAEHPFHRQVFEKLKQKYAFYVFPCVNPYGYDNDTSLNANGKKIDGDFDYFHENRADRDDVGPHPWSQPESVAIKNIIETYKPLTLFCGHTHGGYNGFSFRPQVIGDYDVLIDRSMESAIISKGDERRPADGENGDTTIPKLRGRATAYNWAGRQLSSSGKPIIGAAVEPGSEETDDTIGRYGLTGLLILFMHVDHYYTNGALSMV